LRYAELFFRAGSSLIAFLVGYAHCILLSFVPRIACAKPDSDPYFASFVLGLLVATLTALSTVGLPFRGLLRWLVLPFALLVPSAFLGVLPYLEGEAIARMHVCSASAGWAAASASTWWHRAWAPFQLALLLALSAQALRFWRPR